jgi:hypothetical protein
MPKRPIRQVGSPKPLVRRTIHRPKHVHPPVQVASNPPRVRHLPLPPPSNPRPRTPMRRIPRSFDDVFGGAFATSGGPSGQVVSVSSNGKSSNRVGSFRSLSATELEISLPGGFLLRIILKDFDPVTNLAIADTYLVDTMGRPNDSRSWGYRSSGEMRLPVGASPPQGNIQTLWTNFGHGVPGGGTSVSTPTAPQTLVFLP